MQIVTEQEPSCHIETHRRQSTRFTLEASAELETHTIESPHRFPQHSLQPREHLYSTPSKITLLPKPNKEKLSQSKAAASAPLLMPCPTSLLPTPRQGVVDLLQSGTTGILTLLAVFLAGINSKVRCVSPTRFGQPVSINMRPPPRSQRPGVLVDVAILALFFG